MSECLPFIHNHFKIPAVDCADDNIVIYLWCIIVKHCQTANVIYLPVFNAVESPDIRTIQLLNCYNITLSVKVCNNSR